MTNSDFNAQTVNANIGPGVSIKFQSVEDCLLFSATLSSFENFKGVYKSVKGEEPTEEIYQSFQTKEQYEEFFRMIYRTKLSNGLPLWKAIKKGQYR